MTVIVTLERHLLIVSHVGQGQVHIVALRQLDGVTLLTGIHHVLFVVKPRRVARRVIEREVDVVGVVRKYATQMTAQGRGHTRIDISAEFGCQFNGHIGDQPDLVVHCDLLAAVALILVDQRATRQDSPQGHPNSPTQYVPILNSQFSTLRSALPRT